LPGEVDNQRRFKGGKGKLLDYILPHPLYPPLLQRRGGL
jgi:hypothetical protein